MLEMAIVYCRFPPSATDSQENIYVVTQLVKADIGSPIIRIRDPAVIPSSISSEQTAMPVELGKGPLDVEGTVRPGIRAGQ